MIFGLVDHPWIGWGIVSFFIVDHIFLIDSERANDSLYILIEKKIYENKDQKLGATFIGSNLTHSTKYLKYSFQYI